MQLRTQLIKTCLDNVFDKQDYSYQKQLDDMCYKVTHKVTSDYRDLQIMNAYLSVYADILNDHNEGELSRVGTILSDKLPNTWHLKGAEKNEFIYQQYSYYMEMACILDEWVEGIDRKSLARMILELMILNQNIPAYRVFELLSYVKDKLVLLNDVKLVLEEMVTNQSYVYEIIETLGVEQVDKSNVIIDIISKLIQEHEKEVQQFLDGNQKILGFFTGKVMKTSTEKLNPAEVNALLKIELEKQRG
jgi:hypothetical protein